MRSKLLIITNLYDKYHSILSLWTNCPAYIGCILEEGAMVDKSP